MSTLKSSAEHLTLNADGSGNDIKFQSNATEVAAIDQAGNLTLSGTVDGVDVAAAGALATNALPKAGGTMTGAFAADTINNASGNLTIASTQSILMKFDSDNNQTNREFNIQNNSGDQILKITEAGVSSFTGNVGIGTTSPTAKLHIEAPDNTDLMRFTVTGNEMWAFKGASAAGSNDTVSFGIAGGTQAMAWDESGIVTKPYQPAFLVNAGGNSALPLLAATKVNFDSEIFDQNSDFNTTTQTFTAPVTGKYQFNVQLLWVNWDSGASYYYLQIVTSNRTYYELYSGAERSSDVSYCYGHVHVLADMDAGDTAYVALYQNSGNSQTTYDGQSIFTGHLAC